MKRFLAAAVLALTLSGSASAYYHFVHFASRSAPFRAMPEKFDLNALPNKTLSWFLGDTSALVFSPNDTLAALVSQLKAATSVWNDVETSDLRIAYGGVTSGVPTNTPSVDILFDAPPGVIAYGGPTVRAASNGQFVPIQKAVVVINPDFASRPSYSEALFTTLVHEFGHALGLQHSFTSGVMSTQVTRSTGKSKPLTADDVAGLSVLYPRGFAQNTGSISGRVTMGGNGVNMASVVAVAPNGAAISAITNPDGTYTIEGLPLQRGYFVYVHPLPPPLEGQPSPGDIVLPQDANGRTFNGSAPFETGFYSTTGVVNNVVFATMIPANPGVPVNFAVRQRSGYFMHSVQAYAFPGSFAARPPFLSPGMQFRFVVASGENVPANLNAATIGGPDLIISRYPAAPSYFQIDFYPRTLAVPSNSPRHVVFSSPGTNDIYVLPSAFHHVERQAPMIAGIQSSTDGLTRTAQITGVNLLPDTRILFDGVAAQVRNYEELTGGQVRLTVAVPNGAAGYRAVVTALNADGQSSLSVQGDNPPAYTYPADALPAPTALLASPALLSPGTEAMLQIDGLNTQFAEGQVSIGFGTPDVVVRRLWVVGPTRLVVNVVVSPAISNTNLNLTVTSGLQVHTVPVAVNVQGPPQRPFWLYGFATNSFTGGTSLTPGGVASMQVGASPVTLTQFNTTVILNDTVRTLALVEGNQLRFPLPANIPPGIATVRLETGSERSLPVAIWIDPAPRAAGEYAEDSVLRIPASK